MATLSSAREIMSLPSYTDKSDGILFRSNPEISHGSHGHGVTSSLTHGYHHHPMSNHYSQSVIPKQSVSFSEPHIDQERSLNGDVLSRDYHVLRTVEVQTLFQDYDNVMPLTRVNQREEEGGLDSAAHSINEHQVSSVPFPPLDSSDAAAEGGGSVTGVSGRHPSSGGYKGESGDSSSVRGSKLNNIEGDPNVACAGAGASSEADAKKSEMGNDLFSARTANVSDARADCRVKGNKERVNNTGRSRQGTVCDKYTGTRVTDTIYSKLHAETTFIDQPHLSYSLVATQPERTRCDKLIEKTDRTQPCDVDLAATKAGRCKETSELSIIPDTVSTKHVGVKDVSEDTRFITKMAAVCRSADAVSTSETVISTSTYVVPPSTSVVSTSTSVMSGSTKDESTESVVTQSGADLSRNSQFYKSSSVSDAYPVSRSRSAANGETATHTQVTSHNHRGQSINPNLGLALTHIPSTVVLLPELPIIVITPSIPEETSSPSSTSSSPDKTTRNISNSHPCESAMSETDCVESNLVNGVADFSSKEAKTYGANEITSPKHPPVGGVKVLPSTFTFNTSKFKDTKGTYSSVTGDLSTGDTSTPPLTAPVVQGEGTKSVHDLSSADVVKNSQHASEISCTAMSCGISTSNVSSCATTTCGISTSNVSSSAVTTYGITTSNVSSSVTTPCGITTTDTSLSSTSSKSDITRANISSSSNISTCGITTVTASTCDISPTNVSLPVTAPTSGNTTPSSVTITTPSSVTITTESTSSGAAFATQDSVSTETFTAEKTAQPACVFPGYTHLPASGTTDAVACTHYSDDSWNDYAVPSDLPLILYSSATDVNMTSNGKLEGVADNDKTNVKIVNDRKDTSFPHKVAHVDPDREDIYAVPIPKSQRHGFTNSESFQQTTTQVDMPIKPLRSPMSNTAPSPLNDADDDAFDAAAMRKPNRSQHMKKSTTTETLHTYSSDYSNIPNAVSLKYDYFSLGRRPKRPRIQTLTDSQGMAVSLDMLLRARRHSILDMSSPTSNEEALSVDDILKSCLEFDDNCAFYRSRTNSDVVRNSSSQPLSFREVNNIKLLNFDLSVKEKQDKHNAVSPKPILKKPTSCSRRNEMPETKQTPGDSDTLERQKIHSNIHSKPTSPSSDDSSTHGKQNGKQTVISKKKEMRKPDDVKSYILWEAESGTPCQASKDTKDIHSSPKSESPGSNTTCNPDYESVGDSGVSQATSAVVFSSHGSNQNRPAIQDTVDTSRVTPLAVQKADSDVPVTTIPQAADQASTQEAVELATSTINVSTGDARPASLPHLKKSFVTTSTSNGQCAVSSSVTGSSSTESPSLSPDFRDLSSSFSSMPSPSLETGASSEPAVIPSEGVLSLLSVDVREASQGGSPLPGQRSPSCNPKLEAAEALKWLRAAGFPQYAQMFDDGQFPVDMGIVERDHDFLDKDSLQSLFRRLETLNKYAGIKRDSHPCKKTASEEEDEDDCCALSERWEYQKSARRWSRKDLSSPSQKTGPILKDQDLAAHSGSHDSLLADQDSESQIGDSPLLAARSSHQGAVLEVTFPHQSVGQSPGTSDMVSVSHRGVAAAEVTPENSGQTESPMSPRLRRTTSEKMKTAKNIFKKMEGMKSSKSRRQSGHRTIVEISGPVVADKEHMQAKLDKLNCVDILHDADVQLSPPLMRVNVSEPNDRTDSHHLSSHTHVAPASPQSPSSPRPRSDFLLRSKEGMSHVPLHPVTQARPSSVSPNQRPSLPHDTSFEEYHQAQATFLQNLQSSHRSTAESVRKNNSETNLMEIFLVPQDHQPGRFPRVLQNGYIETEACGTGVNVRTGSVRLGRSSCMKSDHSSPGLRSAQLSEANSPSYRLSMYDNCSPSEGKISEGGESSSIIPSAIDVGGSRESKQSPGHLFRDSTEVDKQGFIQEGNSDSSRQDSRDASRESSVVRTAWSFSEQQLRNSDHERSVSFESSTSSQSPDDSTLVNVEELTSTDSKNSRVSSSDSFSSKSKVTHSSSLDSYFKGSSSQNETPVSDSFKAIPPANTFQENYDEFDRILQELYKNINDLTTFMDKDKSEKTPRLVRAATSPLPAGNVHPHSPLHVATLPARPVLRPQQHVTEPNSPSSATSDLVPSPASPRSPQDSSGPLDFYGVLELDHENSSSGGEGSNTAESGSEDQEMALTDVSQDDSLDQITEVSRERRDSGVGHSLTRAPSDRRRKKIRWHSFQKSHRPDISSRAMQINSLTICQLVRLQKLSLLRLTGIMEKCLPVNKSGWNWMVPRFMKRHKAPDFSDKNVFGVPLSVMAQRTGQPLPQCVLYAMRYLRRTCPSAVGIFRKSGVKSKIQQLRDYLEAHPDTTNFDGENAYNVADMLKTYFRDLPECLLTNKMSETFRSIYTYVPQSQRLDAIQAAILLLPDENREVLQSLLLFLSDISEHEADHQMNASNLAVCFTPTVFHLGPRQSVPYSPKRNRKNSSGVPDPREILEQKAAHECLLMMITDCKKLFTVPSNLFRQLQVQSMAHVEPVLLQDIGSCPSDVRAFGQERIQIVLKESHDKNRGWLPTMTIGDVEVFHRKPLDDCLLKEWKLVVDIEAPPVEVLRRIMHERHTWDEDLLSWSVVERLDAHSDIFQFVLNTMAPHPPRNFCELRYWRSDLNKGACALITMSVEHSDSLEIHGVWAIDLGTYFLMEPCGSGRSRLTYLTRVDTRGRMPEWYTKIFGHICANFLDRLKESFKQDTSGPETKV